MATEYDDRVEENHKLENGGFIVEVKNDRGIDDDETSKSSKMPSNISAFILTNSKRIKNHFILLRDGIKHNSAYYNDTHSFHIQKNYWDSMKKKNRTCWG